jgi:glycosyltransferase involved in cell wall biosynthesis
LGLPWRLFEDRGQIEKIMRMADLVLAGNHWLETVAREAGARAEWFPTVVDTDRFTPGAHPPNAYRIGWIGNPSTTICLEPAAEALERVRHAEVCLVGADPARVTGAVCVEHRPWSLGGEVEDLRRFSVGIMPEPAREWMRGKCGLKALQYMACAVPCVATPFGVALDFLRHGENGLLANTTEEWLEAFERLRDDALRARLGKAGRETVEARYALRAAAPRLLELLESVA